MASDLEAIVSLRHRVLHPGGPVERVIYEEDLFESTLHLVLRDKTELVSCGTLINEGQGVFRIRGMAVSQSLRGRGVGTGLVKAFVDYFRAQDGAKLLWCNGRVAALSLYERQGFVKTGDVFDVPGSGPHFRLELK